MQVLIGIGIGMFLGYVFRMCTETNSRWSNTRCDAFGKSAQIMQAMRRRAQPASVTQLTAWREGHDTTRRI